MCPTLQTRHSEEHSGGWLDKWTPKVLLGLSCLVAFSALLIPAASCGSSSRGVPPGAGAQASAFKVESTAFKAGDEIPRKFTCAGEDISPPLWWVYPPQGTRSFALITDDPDAPSGTWVHWVVYDLPAGIRDLANDVPKQAEVPSGGLQGRNDFGRIGYGGPCPPPGKAHHYYFKLYALDTTLSLPPGASKEEVLAKAEGHVLGEAQFVGLFKR